MALGRRARAVTPNDPTSPPATRRQTPRHLIGTMLAGLVLGFGGVAAGTSLVHASERTGLFNFLEDLFRGPAPEPVAPRPSRRSPVRYSSLPDARRIHAAAPERRYTPRPAAVELTRASRPRRAARIDAPAPVPALATGRQTVCVRTCDGYLFPLGRLGSKRDIPMHEAACAAACPSAATALFTLPNGGTELSAAVSLKGQPYLASAWANVYQRKRVENCSCQPRGVAAVPLPIARDPTVRVGDVVATEDGADVVTTLARGRVELDDFRSARGITRRARAEIDGRVGALRRDTAETAFRRTLRAQGAKTARVRVAEARAARLRVSEADTGLEAARPERAGRGAAPVRVVVPSPFDRTTVDSATFVP